MLIDRETQARLDEALAGQDHGRYLEVGSLEVGSWGILDVVVDQVHPARPFQRKRGGEGFVGRVALRDASGVIDMVLWDAENRLTADGPLTPGAALRIRGATVKAGWKEGLELGLGSAVIEARPPPASVRLEGSLLARSEPQVVGDPPRTKVEAVLEVQGEQVIVICWDAAITQVEHAVGAPVSVLAQPHPALDGYYIA